MFLLNLPLTSGGLSLLPYCLDISGPISGLVKPLQSIPHSLWTQASCLWSHLARIISLIKIFFYLCMPDFWIPAVKGDSIQNICKSATNSLAFLNYFSHTLRNSPWTTLKLPEHGKREQQFLYLHPVLHVPCLHFSGDARWILMETSQAERKFDGLWCFLPCHHSL